MERMLKLSEKDYLTHDHIPIRDFNMSQDLVQAMANAQARTGEDFLQKTDPAQVIRTYKGPNPTISDEQKNNILATKEDDAQTLGSEVVTKDE